MKALYKIIYEVENNRVTEYGFKNYICKREKELAQDNSIDIIISAPICFNLNTFYKCLTKYYHVQ